MLLPGGVLGRAILGRVCSRWVGSISLRLWVRDMISLCEHWTILVIGYLCVDIYAPDLGTVEGSQNMNYYFDNVIRNYNLYFNI